MLNVKASFSFFYYLFGILSINTDDIFSDNGIRIKTSELPI